MFKDFYELGDTSFRIIIVDGLQAQNNAIEEIFPDSFIVYCLAHIRRDLISMRSSSDLVMRSSTKRSYSICKSKDHNARNYPFKKHS